MAFKGRGRIVNRTELAEVFGVSLPTVSAWVRKGCPYVKKGSRSKPWEFNTRDVTEWLKDEVRAESEDQLPKDETALKLRKLAAETAQAELQLAKDKSQVALLEDFERVMAMQNATLRTNIMNVPSRVVSQLIGEKDEERFKKVLSGELVQALEAAANNVFDLEEDVDMEEISEQ